MSQLQSTGHPSTLPLPYPEHSDLSYYIDANGYPRPVLTPADWKIRRQHILAHMQSVMGPLPDRTKRVPLKMQVLEEFPAGEAGKESSVTRAKVEYQTEDSTKVSAYLFTPQNQTEKRSAVLCLHQTVAIGKQEPAGLGGNPNLHYARHLARRGHVTLAPDYPSFGDYQYDFAGQGYISGSMKAIWDNMRAIDLLETLPMVDAKRIGCIGHSLGGHNTMFTAVFDERIKALVSNCGFTRFHKYYGGKLKGWTSDRYMPLINQRYDNNSNRVPFDFPEIVAAFAPRAFLASSPKGDNNFEVSGVVDSVASARPIYELLGVPDRLAANYPDCAHDFPEPVREVAYHFLEKHL
jgi:dienelactone hydrolase